MLSIQMDQVAVDEQEKTQVHGQSVPSLTAMDWEAQEGWRRLEEQKRRGLLEADCDEAMKMETVDELKANLQEMINRFGGRDMPRFVDRLNTTLEHLKSFTNAITSVSQYAPVGCLVWGGIQAVMESACKASYMSEDVVEMLVELSSAVPQFETYLALFPGKPQLQWSLQDLFDDFMTYCIIVCQYFRRGYTWNLLRYFLVNTPQKELLATKVKIRRHVEEFREAAKAIHREQVHAQHLEVTRILGSALTKQPSRSQSRSASVTRPSFPVSTVTLSQNPTFVGRDDLIESVHKILHKIASNVEYSKDTLVSPPSLKTSKKTPACCVLHGLGGMGKTQIALEYYFRHRSDYDAIFWLKAEHDWTLAASYARIADKLGLVDRISVPEDRNRMQGMAIEAARIWLETTERKWLLIFDNVEEQNDLSPYIPMETAIAGSIILTTQNPNTFPVTPIFGSIAVMQLTTQAASSLLFKYLDRKPENEEEEETAHELCDFIGSLPLAIATIGGYIKQAQGYPLKELIETLTYSSNAWTSNAYTMGPLKQYERNLQNVFDIALKALSPKARSMINILSFLDPDSIPEKLFTTSISRKSLPFLRTKADLVEIFRELHQRQLVRRYNSGPDAYFSIHRTVQWNVLLHLSEDLEHRWRCFREAFTVVQDVLPEMSALTVPEPDKWPLFERYGIQILGLRSHSLWPDPPVQLSIEFAQVLSDMGTYMWHAGKFSEGRRALETAETILDERQAGRGHPLRSNIYVLLGVITSFEGVSERKRSLDLRYKARESRQESLCNVQKEKLSQKDQMLLWNVESDLAYGFAQEESFEEVANIMERCLAQYRIWDPQEDALPYEYSKYYQLMSFYLMSQGKPVDAIQAITNCERLMVKAAGPTHPMTYLIRFCMATLTWHAGEPEKALQIYEAVLEARKKILGEFSHFTLESYSMCGRLYLQFDRYEEARVCLDTCLQRRKRAIWTDEGVARAQYWYADVLDHLGEYEEADKQRQAAQNALVTYRARYRSYFPDPDDDEAVLDQMVSLWAGRLTGKLKQQQPDFRLETSMSELQISGRYGSD